MENLENNAWVFDSLVGFLHGPVWNIPLQTFIEEKSLREHIFFLFLHAIIDFFSSNFSLFLIKFFKGNLQYDTYNIFKCNDVPISYLRIYYILAFEPTDDGEVLDRPEYKKIHNEYRNLVSCKKASLSMFLKFIKWYKRSNTPAERTVPKVLFNMLAMMPNA